MLKFLGSRGRPTPRTLYVVGNESADMDSCNSSLVAAYLKSCVSKDEVQPVIQIPRAEFRLRKDIKWLYDNLGIDEDWVGFKDTVELNFDSRLFLVDHNSPTVPGKVELVIDHHALEGSSVPQGSVMDTTGSCMTLIVDYFRKRVHSDLFANDSVLRKLCLAPILLDTKALQNDKTTQLDRDIVQFLGGISSDTLDSYSIMTSEKKNLDGLTATEVLLKDYKQFGTIGVSSLPKLLTKIAALYPDFVEDLKDFKRQRNLTVMVAMASGTEKKQFVRQMAVAADSIEDFERVTGDLKLHQENEEQGVRFYNQLNIAASRKQVAPMVRKLL